MIQQSSPLRTKKTKTSLLVTQGGKNVKVFFIESNENKRTGTSVVVRWWRFLSGHILTRCLKEKKYENRRGCGSLTS